MKAVKVIGWIALVLIIAIVVVFGVAITLIDRTVQMGIEQGGSYALGVDTRLESADVSLFGGRFDMSELVVSNPEGYDTPHFLRLGTGGVSISYSTLTSDTIRLPTLTLETIDVYLEKEEGKANYTVILENLKRFESGDSPAKEPQSDVAKQDFVIEKLAIRNITVHAEVLGEQPIDIPVDEIVLTGVGSKGGDAVELAGVVSIVVKAVMLSAVQAGATQLPGAVLQELQSELSGLESLSQAGVEVAATIGGVTKDLGGLAQDIAQGAFRSAEDLAKGLGEGVEGVGKAIDEAGQGLQDAAKGVQDLLGGKKDKEPNGGG